MTGWCAAATTSCSTPAARAVTAPITTDDGYGLRPPGAYTAARRTGTSRSRTVCPCGRATPAARPPPPPPHRPLAQPHGLPLRQRDLGLAVHAGLGDRAHVGDRGLQAV